MFNWLVPITMVHWNGREKKRTVPIKGNVSEWQAQSLALLKCRWVKGQFYSPKYIHDGPRYNRNFTVGSSIASHAIDKETMRCNHGCCRL